MLTDQEIQAIREYKLEGYCDINDALRNEDTVDAVELLDSAMAKSVLAEASTVYRGTDFESMWLDEDEDYTGQVISDLAFVSTTRKQALAASKFYRGLLLEIELPAGTHAIVPDEILPESEAEIILDRGLTFEVIADNCDEDNRVMRVRVV